jgi:serine/threonine protein kinase
MRKATRIGEFMSGGLRMGAPPESVIGCDLDLSASQDQIKSVSFDGMFNKTKEVDYDTGMEYDGPIPEFAPEEVCAHPTWDIFSFGLIMAQLLLGQSMVLLPNFERPEDAHLKRLYNYDMAALQKIVAATRKTSGHLAAELLEKCLQPFPENRPQSMESILNDPFFQVETE